MSLFVSCLASGQSTIVDMAAVATIAAIALIVTIAAIAAITETVTVTPIALIAAIAAVYPGGSLPLMSPGGKCTGSRWEIAFAIHTVDNFLWITAIF